MTEYNGWTNYETWNVPLWVDNDCGGWEMRLRYLKPGDKWTAEHVEQFVRSLFPEGTPDVSVDRFDKVNWQEIADNWNIED